MALFFVLMLLTILHFLLFPQEIVPPGTLRVGAYYIDQTEVLKIHWLEYIHFRSLEIPEAEHWRLLPAAENDWYRIPERRHEPITHITYEQAVDYCHWRTRVVQENFGFAVNFRLPTPVEWTTVAQTIYDQHRKSVSKRLDRLKKRLKQNGPYYVSRRSHPKNKVVDLFVNVSEMTATKGIAKGGNHQNILSEEILFTDVSYAGSHAFLGFRCIAEISPR